MVAFDRATRPDVVSHCAFDGQWKEIGRRVPASGIVNQNVEPRAGLDSTQNAPVLQIYGPLADGESASATLVF